MTWRAELDEEKRRILSTRRYYYECSPSRKANAGYTDNLRVRVEELVQREKSCSEMESIKRFMPSGCNGMNRGNGWA